MPLSDLKIRAAKPAAKAYKLFDGDGLFIDVRPEGGRLWRLKYRYAGAEKLLALGRFPDTSLKQARDARDTARKLLAEGVDPSASRKAERAARQAEAMNTLAAVGRVWLRHRATAWKAGTYDATSASLENDVFPKLGSRPIAEIAPAEIRDVVQAIEARGASETARRVFQRIQAIFRHAVAHDLVRIDPTYPLKPSEIFKPYKVKQRMKMGTEHIVPLSTRALELLKEWRPAGATTGLVFPSPFYPDKPLSDGTLNSALARLGYKGIATAHGFRTLFSTCANEAGWNRDAIKDCSDRSKNKQAGRSILSGMPGRAVTQLGGVFTASHVRSGYRTMRPVPPHATPPISGSA